MDIKKAGIKYLLLLMTGLMILLFSFNAVYAEDITETGITEDDAVTAAADSAEMNAGTNAADGSADISEEISEETAAEADDCSEGHLWGEWEVITEPTYHKSGSRKHICLQCGTEETQKIEKLKAKNKWVFENDKWYYLGSNGKFVKNRWKKLRLYGEKKESVRWCLFSKSGALKKNISKDTAGKWVKAGSRKYWFTVNKKPAGRGFRLIGDKVYYLDDSGAMVKGKFKTKGGKKYTTNKDGSLSGLIYYKTKYRTFVLIDISEQKLRFYRDGKRKMTANVVTGMRGVNDTPRGVFRIMSKSRNVNLVGPTWNLHVSYWMLFRYGGYGIHDATWRSDAQIDSRSTYIRNGSHGCVNMKAGDAGRLYNMVSTGTTVIVCS